MRAPFRESTGSSRGQGDSSSVSQNMIGSPDGVEMRGLNSALNPSARNNNNTDPSLTPPPLLTQVSTEDSDFTPPARHAPQQFPSVRSTPPHLPRPPASNQTPPSANSTGSRGSSVASRHPTRLQLPRASYSGSPFASNRQQPAPQDIRARFSAGSAFSRPTSPAHMAVPSSMASPRSRISTGSYQPFGGQRFSDIAFNLDSPSMPRPSIVRDTPDYDTNSDSDTTSVKEPFTDQVKSLNKLLTSTDQGLGPLAQTSFSPDLEDDYLNDEMKDLEAARRSLQKELSAVDYSILEETPDNSPNKPEETIVAKSSSESKNSSGSKRSPTSKKSKEEEHSSSEKSTPSPLSTSIYRIFGFRRKLSRKRPLDGYIQPNATIIGDDASVRSAAEASVASSTGRKSIASLSSIASSSRRKSTTSSIGAGSASGESIFQSLADFSEKYAENMPSPDQGSIESDFYDQDASNASARFLAAVQGRPHLPELTARTSPPPPMAGMKITPDIRKQQFRVSLGSYNYPSPLFHGDEHSSPEDSRLLPNLPTRSDEEDLFYDAGTPGTATERSGYSSSGISMKNVGMFDAGSGKYSPVAYGNVDGRQPYDENHESMNPPQHYFDRKVPEIIGSDTHEHTYSFDISEMPPTHADEIDEEESFGREKQYEETYEAIHTPPRGLGRDAPERLGDESYEHTYSLDVSEMPETQADEINENIFPGSDGHYGDDHKAMKNLPTRDLDRELSERLSSDELKRLYSSNVSEMSHTGPNEYNLKENKKPRRDLDRELSERLSADMYEHIFSLNMIENPQDHPEVEDEEEYEVNFEPENPTRRDLDRELSERLSDDIYERLYSFTVSETVQNFEKEEIKDEIHFDPENPSFRDLDRELSERLDDKSYEKDFAFNSSKMPQSYGPDKSADTFANIRKRRQRQLRNACVLCLLFLIVIGCAIGLAIGLTGESVGPGGGGGGGPNEGGGTDDKIIDSPSEAPSVTTQQPSASPSALPTSTPTISFAPSISPRPTSMPTKTPLPTTTFPPSPSPSRLPSSNPTMEPSTGPSISPSSSPTINRLSFETLYSILVTKGTEEAISSEVYEPDLIESMDRLSIEIEQTLTGESRRRLTAVILPSVIRQFSEETCPNPNGIDRCELVTAAIFLTDAEDDWHNFKLVLEVAIRIGRLQFHLDQVNPNSAVEILPPFIGRIPAGPSPAPSPALSSIPSPALSSLPSIAPSPGRSSLPSIAPSLTLSSVPSIAPSLAPTSFASVGPSSTNAPTTFALFQFLVDNSFDGGTALRDGTSPQNQAFVWLSGNANIELYSSDQILQRYALATLYFSTGGDNWFFNTGWLSDDRECNWFNKAGRRSCGARGELKSLELDYNNVGGWIPPEIGLLSNLERLVFRGGPSYFIGGTIPKELGHIANLELFFIQNNHISGQIPNELGNWTQLKQLDLSSNRLTGSIPTEFGRLRELTLLNIGYNELSGIIPSEIGRMDKMTKLLFENNMLSGPIPTEIGFLRRLQDLNGGMNMISSIPTELGRLTVCDTIILNDNNIQGTIPTRLGYLNRLKYLDLSKNVLTGTIPTEIGNLANSRADRLDFSYNRLSGQIPSEIGFLDKLRVLSLQANVLTGIIPSTFSNLMRLTTIRLDSNDLFGTVPYEICEVFNSTYPAFQADCHEFDDGCPCCTTCCQDELGCECRYMGTDMEFLCFQQKN